jgi:predicted  nucleic acid-binding Zn-ribbon protein
MKAAKGLDREKKKLIDRIKASERELAADKLRIAALEAELQDKENTIEWIAEQAAQLREACPQLKL